MTPASSEYPITGMTSGIKSIGLIKYPKAHKIAVFWRVEIFPSWSVKYRI